MSLGSWSRGKKRRRAAHERFQELLLCRGDPVQQHVAARLGEGPQRRRGGVVQGGGHVDDGDVELVRGQLADFSGEVDEFQVVLGQGRGQRAGGAGQDGGAPGGAEAGGLSNVVQQVLEHAAGLRRDEGLFGQEHLAEDEAASAWGPVGLAVVHLDEGRERHAVGGADVHQRQPSPDGGLEPIAVGEVVIVRPPARMSWSVRPRRMG